MQSRTALALLLALAPLAPVALQDPAPDGGDDATGVATLAWLAGAWENRAGDRVAEEHWIAPRGRTMLGVNRTSLPDRTTAFEFLRIVEDGEGRVSYLAQPGGREPTEFAATSIAADEVLFENPEHDFPSRIRYRRTGERSMVASIEGEIDGEQRVIEFPFERPDS